MEGNTPYENYLMVLEGYREHVSDIEGYDPVTGRVPADVTQFVPSIIDIDESGSGERMAEALVEGWPVVPYYGPTYGTTFLPEYRAAVAWARGEREPWATVSLIAAKETVCDWIEAGQLGEAMEGALQETVDLCEQLSFIRGPASEEALRHVGDDNVSTDGEIQLFPVSDDNPLVRALQGRGLNDVVAVRSSNVAGEPEQPTLEGAADYAQRIGAAIVAGPLKDREREKARERIWSQWILRLCEGGVVECRRAGNTEPETIKRMLVGLGLEFEVREEKPVDYRNYYSSPGGLTKPWEIRKDLLKAGGLG